jgi:hypothetical protein
MLHRIPSSGVIWARHGAQTGSAEIFVRGRWQMRQSEGKRTQNKLSAADLSVPCARLRSPLLKTTLLEAPTRKYLWAKYIPGKYAEAMKCV